MKTGRQADGLVLQASLAILLMLLVFPSTAMAASADEVVDMSWSGIPPEIIIEVIKATGFDDPLNSDTFQYLIEYDVQDEVIDYLLGLTEDEDLAVEVSGAERWGNVGNERDFDRYNYAGGPGFNHDGIYQTGDDEYHRSGYDDSEPHRSADYYFPYGDGYTVYTPPVYVYRGRNNYYYEPYRYYYPTTYGSWHDGTYTIYNRDYHYPYYDYGWNSHHNYRGHGRNWDRYHYDWNPYHYRWYDGQFGGLRGCFGYTRDRGWFYNWDGYYRNDGFTIRLSF